MNKFNEKQNEKGSVLVEVIAVIALLGVMGPLLFRQVMTRNEEVENINIASEMRTLKEAFSAYILTDKARLLRNWSGDSQDCKSVVESDIESFLPYGNEAYGDYKFYLCKNTDDFLQGYIIPEASAMPETVGLKRAARIANLIGADGAICQNGDINGVAGGWGLQDPGGWCHAGSDITVYLVTTGMDTYVPEVTYEDYSTGVVSIPNELALQNLHAWNYFSVGNGQNCYELKHDKTGNYDPEKGFVANNDIIYDANEHSCDPLFWVGTKSSGTDDKAKGDVYVKNNLMVGRVNGSKQAIGLFHADTASGTADTAYNADRSEGNKIVVYDNMGKEKITINGKGEIIAKGETGTSGTEETMKMTNQGLESSLKTKNGNENYKVDPAYTSVMNDIKLDSRGGARLSDILPNYISRGVYELDSSHQSVHVPTCPSGYAPAVIVTPTMWKEKPKVVKTDIEGNLKTKEFEIPAQGSSSSSKVGPIDITAQKDLEVQNADLKITISNAEKAYATNGGSWTIKFLSGTSSSVRTDVKGLAQTFCVYDTAYSTSGKWSNGKEPKNLDRSN